ALALRLTDLCDGRVADVQDRPVAVSENHHAYPGLNIQGTRDVPKLHSSLHGARLLTDQMPQGMARVGRQLFVDNCRSLRIYPNRSRGRRVRSTIVEPGQGPRHHGPLRLSELRHLRHIRVRGSASKLAI